ncbi:MAG: amidohydrolase family protein [Actinobacteria bacterium]|nr:amidohydrolase family protein [Actinomycetota bacterium]
MIIDGHVHMGVGLYGRSVTAETAISRMDASGIEACIAFPAKPRTYSLAEANSNVAAAQLKYAGRIFGLARVDPWQGDAAIVELERACDELSLKGIALDPSEENFQINSRLVDPIIQFALEMDLPVVVEGGYPHVSHPLQIADLAARFPDVTFVMTHGGELDLSGFTRRDAHTAMCLCPNLVMGTSGLCSHERLVSTVDQLGAERVMFESHLPVMDERLELLRVTKAAISDAARELALGGNARRVFL